MELTLLGRCWFEPYLADHETRLLDLEIWVVFLLLFGVLLDGEHVRVVMADRRDLD